MVLRSASGDILADPGEGRREVGPDQILLRKMKITATETKPTEHSEQQLQENNTESCNLYNGSNKEIVETESSQSAGTEEIILNTNFRETVTKVGKSDSKSFTVGDKENVLENFGELSKNKNNTDQKILSNEERKKPETKQSEITVLPKTKIKDIQKIPNKRQNVLEENKIKNGTIKSSPEKKVSKISNKNIKAVKDPKIETEQINKPSLDKIKTPSISERTLNKSEAKNIKNSKNIDFSIKSVDVTNDIKIAEIKEEKSEPETQREPVMNHLKTNDTSKKTESPIMEEVASINIDAPKDITETKSEKLSLAKELFTEIADEMSTNRSSTLNFQLAEPKEWTEDPHRQTDDEFLMVIEDQEPELAVLQSRSASKDRAKKVINSSEGDLRPGSTGYHHLDEFERKVEEMRRELENEVGLDDSLDIEGGKDEFDLIKDQLTGSTLRRMKNVVETQPAVQEIPEHDECLPSLPEAPARRRSSSRTRDSTPTRFLSAMTGGFVESKRFGSIVSLVRNRSRSRSRFSEHSGDLPPGVLPEIVAGAEVVVDKLRKITGRKRNVKQVDFDELFARGLAMGDQHEEKKAAEMTAEAPMIQFEEDTGINLKDCESERGRDRGRKRRKIPPPPEDLEVKKDKTRTQSREYAKPEEIRLSPAPKRDLLTGKPLGGCSQEELFLHKVTNFIAQNQLQLQAKQDNSLIRQLEAKQKQSDCDLLNPDSNKSKILKNSPPRLPVKLEEKLEPSAGKSFLESRGGQEVFTQSIDQRREVETYEEPADRKLPKILRPERLQANQEFYENLRTGLRQLAREKPGEADYSKNLGRVEVGTLKKKSHLVAIDSGEDNSIGVPSEEGGERGRNPSMFSDDHSTALPDLEVRQEDSQEDRQEESVVESFINTEADQPVETRVVEDVPATRDSLSSHTEAGAEDVDRKQQLAEAKAWIQNSLITVVGFGVLAYLQTLEA